MLHCRYYQALHSLVMAPGEATEVVLLYGSKSASDVLLKDKLDGPRARARTPRPPTHRPRHRHRHKRPWSGRGFAPPLTCFSPASALEGHLPPFLSVVSCAAPPRAVQATASQLVTVLRPSRGAQSW